jgi:hypothetical protein
VEGTMRSSSASTLSRRLRDLVGRVDFELRSQEKSDMTVLPRKSVLDLDQSFNCFIPLSQISATCAARFSHDQSKKFENNPGMEMETRGGGARLVGQLCEGSHKQG